MKKPGSGKRNKKLHKGTRTCVWNHVELTLWFTKEEHTKKDTVVSRPVQKTT